MFELSKRSNEKLDGVNPNLVAVVRKAITLTKVDFGVICGRRTVEEQTELYNSGASQTMNSKHLTGNAVDLMAYIGSRGSWELNLYDNIADAMQQAAQELNVPLRWGAAWNTDDIRDWKSSMEDCMNYYVDVRRREGKRPFIDGPHFETF